MRCYRSRYSFREFKLRPNGVALAYGAIMELEVKGIIPKQEITVNLELQDSATIEQIIQAALHELKKRINGDLLNIQLHSILDKKDN